VLSFPDMAVLSASLLAFTKVRKEPIHRIGRQNDVNSEPPGCMGLIFELLVKMFNKDEKTDTCMRL